MPDFFSRRLLLLLGLLLSLTLPALATHIVGAELSYVPVPGNARRFQVTAKVYREASAMIDFGSTMTLFTSLNGCGPTTGRSTQLTRYSSTLINYLRCSNGGPVNMQLFYGEVELPTPGTWTLSLAAENRTFGIVNLPDSDNYGMYAEAQVSIFSTPHLNTSPVFTSTMLPYICGTQFHRYSFAAYDADGDSLVYSLTPPRAANVADPCPVAMPVTPAPHFTINPASGELSTVPFGLNLGNYIMAVRVDEYRRIASQWTKIGSVMRDLMYPVSGSSGNRNPTFSALTGGTAPLALDQAIRVNPGQTVALTLTAADQDAGQVLRFSSEVAATIPGAAFQTLSATQARLTWQVPASLPPGRYTMPVVVADNACPINGTTVQTLTFQVTNQVLAAHAGSPRFEPTAFPTPFREQVQFQLATPGRQPVQVVDGLGRVIAELTSQADGTVRWRPAATLAPGLYLARTADGRQIIRLLHD